MIILLLPITAARMDVYLDTSQLLIRLYCHLTSQFFKCEEFTTSLAKNGKQINFI